MASKLARSTHNHKTCRTTTVHDLPDECLAVVLSHLQGKQHKDAASLACRRWRSLEALSRHSIRLFCSRVTRSATQWYCRLLHTFPNIFLMEIAGDFTPFLSVLQSYRFTQIRTLVLEPSAENFSDKSMARLAEGCPALISLKVDLIREENGESMVTDVGIEMVLTRCPGIEEMTIRRGLGIQGWGFRQGKQLMRLHIAYCTGINDTLAEGLQGPTSLQTLSLPYMLPACFNLTFLGEHCKHIEVLNLCSCKALNDSSIEAIASGCKKLRVLDVRNCRHIYTHGWKALAREAINLQVLDVSDCDFGRDSLLAIQDGCPALRSLTFAHYWPLSRAVILRFQRARPAVHVYVVWEDNDIDDDGQGG